ncbi:MAG: hypothetical protein ACKV2T_43590 [Kofleriaceae bacterium]
MPAFERRPVRGRQAASSGSTSVTSTLGGFVARDANIAATRRATPQEYANAFGHFTEANIEELGGGSHQRSDGVHGLDSRGSMVDGGGNGGQSGARDAAKNQPMMSAAERAHGGTFGGQRMWGDGSGEAFFGEGPGMRDSRGHASSGLSRALSQMATESRTKSTNTPANERGNDRGSGSSAIASEIGGANPHGGVASAASEITNMVGAAASMVSSVFGGGASTAAIGAGTATSSSAATGAGSPTGASAKRPREDQDGTGNVVLGAADSHAQGAQIVRAMSRYGRGDDGRGDRDTSTSSTGGATTTQRERAGGERATEASGGAVNWDLALKINQLVNPGAG